MNILVLIWAICYIVYRFLVILDDQGRFKAPTVNPHDSDLAEIAKALRAVSNTLFLGILMALEASLALGAVAAIYHYFLTQP